MISTGQKHIEPNPLQLRYYVTVTNDNQQGLWQVTKRMTVTLTLTISETQPITHSANISLCHSNTGQAASNEGGITALKIESFNRLGSRNQHTCFKSWLQLWCLRSRMLRTQKIFNPEPKHSPLGHWNEWQLSVALQSTFNHKTKHISDYVHSHRSYRFL